MDLSPLEKLRSENKAMQRDPLSFKSARSNEMWNCSAALRRSLAFRDAWLRSEALCLNKAPELDSEQTSAAKVLQ